MSISERKCPSDWTPLHIAVWNHDFAKIRWLVNFTSVDAKDDQGWTPVHLACAAENSNIFLSHQVFKRRPNQTLLTSRSLLKPPRRVDYSIRKDDERLTAMGILEILLKFKPDLNSGTPHSLLRPHFPTPLHCAASSGWLTHAQALVEAGASVYTGPGCSPLCWVEGGSGGDQPTAIYLRKVLGDRRLALIKQDHETALSRETEASGSSKRLAPEHLEEESLVQPAARRLRLDSQGLPDFLDESPMNTSVSSGTKSKVGLPVSGVSWCPMTRTVIDSNGLCQTCAGISFKDLCSTNGYFHLTPNQVSKLAEQCKFCKIILQVLDEDHKLHKHRGSQIMIRISNGNKRHLAVCDKPPILRTLEFRLSAGCTCLGPYSKGALDFTKCRGSCESIEVPVSIFSENETPLRIPIELRQDIVCNWSVQEGRVIDPDPLSHTSVKVIHNWIENCSTSHQHCRRENNSKYSQSMPNIQEVSLPTRVIDVKCPIGTSIRLCNGTGKYGHYLTLSHRWATGPMPQWVTMQDTLESRYNWFALESLPKSIADAVTVTRKLGLQYLWVDSLCIVQDSSDDWEVESSRMASIYANAHITLFADCGKDDYHGFLFTRQTFPSTEVILPIREGESVKLNIRRSSKKSFRSVQFSQFSTNVENSYLSKRGWVFQERVLSRRILHFGKDQMFWECNEGTFAEDGHVVFRRGLVECGQQEGPFSKLAYSSTLDDPAPVSQELFTSQWERLVKAYSTLRLTNEEDKLPALSGLAAAFYSRTQNDQYVAGIWRKSLPKQLAWSITNKKPEKDHRVFHIQEYKDFSVGYSWRIDNSFVHSSQLFHRPYEYRAPTFSWVSVDGEIEFHDLPNPCSTIVSVTVDIPSESPYGRLKSGSLIIAGPLRQARSYGPLKKDSGGSFCTRKAGYIPLYDEGWPIGYMLPDSKDDVDKNDVYCLKLGENKYSTSIFLVLTVIEELEAALLRFRRIGLGMTLDETQFFEDAEFNVIELL